MSLINQIRDIQEESYNKWFERYWKNLNLENKIIQSAQKGYSAYRIGIMDGSELRNQLSEEELYTIRRLRDSRTTGLLQEMLGEGLTVKLIQDPYTVRLFGAELKRTKEYILISWEEKEWIRSIDLKHMIIF